MADKRYSVIYADPPWKYDFAQSASRSIERRYSTMTTEEICALDMDGLAAEDCALFMWATMPKMPDAFKVIDAWKFTYTTCAFVWVKQNRADDYREPQLFYPSDKEAFNLFLGAGYWTRQNAELCLLAKRGQPKRASMDVPQIILSPVSLHSAKPAETRTRIVRLMGDVSRVELFARERAEGWDVWGNEVESDVELVA